MFDFLLLTTCFSTYISLLLLDFLITELRKLYTFYVVKLGQYFLNTLYVCCQLVVLQIKFSLIKIHKFKELENIIVRRFVS